MYIYPLFFRFPSHLDHRRPLSSLWYTVGSHSVQFSRSVVSDSATPWIAACQASLSISVVPFSSCPQSFPASGFSLDIYFIHSINSIYIYVCVYVYNVHIYRHIYVCVYMYAHIYIYVYKHTHIYMYRSIPISQFTPIPPSCIGNHKFVLYICESISALQINLSVS